MIDDIRMGDAAKVIAAAATALETARRAIGRRRAQTGECVCGFCQASIAILDEAVETTLDSLVRVFDAVETQHQIVAQLVGVAERLDAESRAAAGSIDALILEDVRKGTSAEFQEWLDVETLRREEAAREARREDKR